VVHVYFAIDSTSHYCVFVLVAKIHGNYFAIDSTSHYCVFVLVAKIHGNYFSIDWILKDRD
jgi:hypothetical protein